MSTAIIVSEDFTNAGQSWTHRRVTRITGGVFRTEIRKNAYQHQSHAVAEVWTGDGWAHHTSLPREDWYGTLPSYTQGALTESDRDQFRWLANELLERVYDALFGTSDRIEYRETERASEYEEVRA